MAEAVQGHHSDIFKGTSLAQSNLNLIASQLTRTVDFGLSKSFSRIAELFAAQQSAWLKSIGPTLARLKASFYPPNLRGIEGLEFEEVEQVVMLDGIPLYGVPRTSIAEALIRAEGAAKRKVQPSGGKFLGDGGKPSRLTVVLRLLALSRKR